LVGNLLDMTRLELGALRPNIEPHYVEELVGVALNRMARQLKTAAWWRGCRATCPSCLARSAD